MTKSSQVIGQIMASSYHQAPFALLHDELHEAIRTALIEETPELCSKFLLERLPVGESPPEQAWPIFLLLLEELERNMQSVLAKRTILFWFHMYRRTFPVLSPKHRGQTDSWTAALVRKITELAFLKFGKISDLHELQLSSHVNPKKILGGYLYKAVARQRKSTPSVIRTMGAMFRASPQWVITDFKQDDFVSLYRVEGLAYEYWRVTALMRALGKGANVSLDQTGDWDINVPQETRELIKSIDERAEAITFQTSLSGTWFANQGEVSIQEELPHSVISAQYNVYGARLLPHLTKGIELPDDYKSNFVPGIINLRTFLDSHDYLAEPFQKKWGVALDICLATIWAIGGLFYLNGKVTTRADLSILMVQILARGYKILDVKGTFDPVLLTELAQMFVGEIRKVSQDEVLFAVKFLSLDSVRQHQIGLWSGGPRPLVIAFDNEVLVDLTAIGDRMFSLFVGLRHDGSRRGDLFEEQFVNEVKKHVNPVYEGEFVTNDGRKFELDAAIIIDGQLVIFECVSIERPLDYEIGRPETFRARRERLEEKLDQVFGYQAIISADPLGRNYDFGGARKVTPIVVSPFVEWIWEKSQKLWLPDGSPRIMSATEAINYMKKLLDRKAN